MRYLLPCIALVILPFTAFAAEQEDSDEEEIADLRARISALEKRIEEEIIDGDEEDGHEDDFNTLGGAMWLNYALRDYSETSRNHGGDFRFDLFRIDANGRDGDMTWSGQFRWYQYMSVIHHAWVGWDFTENTSMQVGISQKPWGIQPYASHSYWFGVPYYIGYEDDYDTGVRLKTKQGNWDLQFGIYKNPEYNDPSVVSRYSFDIVSANGRNNEEVNQLNGRVAYDWSHGEDSNTELGVSVEAGQLYNADTGRNGDRSAWAVHLDGDYGKWGVEFEYFQYDFEPLTPVGVRDDVVEFGAFAGSYTVAAQGEMFVLNFTRDFNLDIGPFSAARCYSDFSVLKKKNIPGATDTKLHTIGCGITSGPVYTFVDIIRSQNHHFLGVPSTVAFAKGDPNPSWNTRFNINIGIYF